MSGNYPHHKSIDLFVDRLAPHGPLLVLLFGSVAKGDFTTDSDADVLTVFAESKNWSDVYAYSDGWVQPVVLSLSELKKRLRDGDSFVHEIVEDGLLLSGSTDLWKELQEMARATQHRLGMTRFQSTWSYRQT